jgi:hypothetical protein
MPKNKTIILFLYILFCILFLIATTKYLTDYDLINIAGQKDIEQYYLIAKMSPKLPDNNENILAHVSSRFAVPYVAGIIKNLFSLELFDAFKYLNFFFLTLFVIILLYFLNSVTFSFKEQIIFLSLLFLNPYIIRQHLFQPVQAHDLFFFSLTIIFAKGVIQNKFPLILLSTLLMVFIRQTSLAFFIGGIIYLIFNKKKNYKNIIIFFILFILTFKIISMVGNSISTKRFSMNYAYGIFFYDFSEYKELIKFLLLPFLSFFPLLILMTGGLKKIMTKDLLVVAVFFIISALMIAQPILGGPTYTQRNIMRIATLSYVITSLFVFFRFDINKLFQNKYSLFIFVIGLFVWSLHPLYSIFDFFSILRF